MSKEPVRIYPSARVPRIDHLHTGRVPFRAYETLVDRIKVAIADEEEEKTCTIVHTLNGPEAWYDHTLSPIEQAEREKTEALDRLDRIKRLLPRTGEVMTADDMERLRAIVG